MTELTIEAIDSNRIKIGLFLGAKKKEIEATDYGFDPAKEKFNNKERKAKKYKKSILILPNGRVVDRYMRFHSSFDELILVIKKCHEIDRTKLKEFVSYTDLATGNIKGCYEGVLKFIDWYNVNN